MSSSDLPSLKLHEVYTLRLKNWVKGLAHIDHAMSAGKGRCACNPVSAELVNRKHGQSWRKKLLIGHPQAEGLQAKTSKPIFEGKWDSRCWRRRTKVV